MAENDNAGETGKKASGNMMNMLRISKAAALLSGVSLIAGCANMDLDLRDRLGGNFDTSQAAENATATRPTADARGVISYPGYQVAVARRGDTLGTLASRVGTDPAALAKLNGMKVTDTLRNGEVIALPSASGATTTTSTATIATPQVAVTSLGSDKATTAQKQSPEPLRHKVTRGETAYTIARLYDVPVKALAEWNGLDERLSVREGQQLLIPVAAEGTNSITPEPVITQPGNGSPTPTPPSAVQPLPKETETAAKPATPSTTTATKTPAPAPDPAPAPVASTGQLAYPVQGTIIREYIKDKNDGIDINASPGAAVKAADGGIVAAITRNTEDMPIIVVKHPNDLLTVYANVTSLKVKKGDTVARGQTLAQIRSGDASYLHFEVRKGFESVDPITYLK